MIQKYVLTSGTTQASDGTQTSAVIAAQTGKTIRVTAIVFSVTAAAVGGGGIVALQDGSTTIIQFDANSASAMQVNFGDQLGYPLTQGNALNLTVSSAVTTQATVYASAVGYIVG